MVTLFALGAHAGPLSLEHDTLPNLMLGTVGVGSSNPFRPGLPSPSMDTGLYVLARAWEVRLNVRREGDDALLLHGTSSVTDLSLTWNPTFADHPNRLIRVGLGHWLLLDHRPWTGWEGHVGLGVQNRYGSVAGFVEGHQNYYEDNGPVDGLTLGADLRAHHKFGFLGVKAGLAGLRRPMVGITMGVGAVWGERPLGPI